MKKVAYLSKNYVNSNGSWKKFGAPNRTLFEKWNSQACGIYCLKMIGDTHRLTNKKSIYQLTMECLSKGGYKELPNGEIQGVFHKPLLELGKKYGLSGKVERNLDIRKITSSLSENKYIILSVDKSKINPDLTGGHLILLHTYYPNVKLISLNDSDMLIDKKGKNILIDFEKLQKISNRKGLLLWLDD
jgi:hypothetical protein